MYYKGITNLICKLLIDIESIFIVCNGFLYFMIFSFMHHLILYLQLGISGLWCVRECMNKLFSTISTLSQYLLHRQRQIYWLLSSINREYWNTIVVFVWMIQYFPLNDKICICLKGTNNPTFESVFLNTVQFALYI